MEKYRNDNVSKNSYYSKNNIRFIAQKMVDSIYVQDGKIKFNEHLNNLMNSKVNSLSYSDKAESDHESDTVLLDESLEKSPFELNFWRKKDKKGVNEAATKIQKSKGKSFNW